MATKTRGVILGVFLGLAVALPPLLLSTPHLLWAYRHFWFLLWVGGLPGVAYKYITKENL